MNNWNDNNDRVAQMWDDYILDQDRYSTPDGNEITVPTKADYVYYDNTNGSVIWTDSALIEPGPEYQQIKQLFRRKFYEKNNKENTQKRSNTADNSLADIRLLRIHQFLL